MVDMHFKMENCLLMTIGLSTSWAVYFLQLTSHHLGLRQNKCFSQTIYFFDFHFQEGFALPQSPQYGCQTIWSWLHLFRSFSPATFHWVKAELCSVGKHLKRLFDLSLFDNTVTFCQRDCGCVECGGHLWIRKEVVWLKLAKYWTPDCLWCCIIRWGCV